MVAGAGVRTLGIIIVALMLTGTAVAGPLEDAADAYEHGDYSTALTLWRPLADQGDAQAQYNLGRMYDYGWGVSPDLVQAAHWYRLSADQGNGGAQYSLAFRYFLGRDYAEAAKWYRVVAEQGNALAQAFLGTMCANGQGVPQDYVEAYKWNNLAASRFSASEKDFRDIALRNRDRIATKMTPEQIAEAQKLASEWTAK